jgi:cytochrome c peroxidase
MTAFRDQCEACHAARLSANDPATTVPFDRWESLVLSPGGPLRWGRAGYEKTGILPYVHADGARVPSLRRLARKRPYFTNGSARTLASLLDAARYDGGSFSHHGAGGVPPGSDSRAALLAFLDLL